MMRRDLPRNGDDPKRWCSPPRSRPSSAEVQKPVVIDMFATGASVTTRATALVHPAADVPGHPGVAHQPRRDLRQEAHRRASHRGESEDARRLARGSTPSSGEPGLQGQRGLAQALGRHQASRDYTTIRGGNTSVAVRTSRIGARITVAPKDFRAPHDPAFSNRRKASDRRRHRLGDRRGACVLLALWTAIGAPVARDVERGTFSQRHSLLIDQRKREPLHPVQPEPAGAPDHQLDALRRGVLGFEYGYSLSEPNALTLWEAQFSHFANSAQVIFDQFISRRAQVAAHVGSGLPVAAWLRRAGAEHSSRGSSVPADVRRRQYADANCTTPANYFHILPPAQARHPQAAHP